jgi:hypothetical protein
VTDKGLSEDVARVRAEGYREGFMSGYNERRARVGLDPIAKKEEATADRLILDMIENPEAPPELRAALEKRFASKAFGDDQTLSHEEAKAFRYFMQKLETDRTAIQDRIRSNRDRRRCHELWIAHLGAQIDVIGDGENSSLFRLYEYPSIHVAPALKAHELVDRGRGKLAAVLHSNDDDADPAVGYAFAESVAAAQKFNLRCLRNADIEPNAAFADELEKQGLFHMPYDSCWFEWDVLHATTLGLLVDQNAKISAMFGRLPAEGWARWLVLGATDISEHLTKLERIVRAAVVIMSSKTTERHVIPAPEKLNRTRAKQGKVPIFSHTLVEVRGVRIVNHDTGEVQVTDRHPRMHWRRGHIRRLRDGMGDIRKVIWIAPMLVGLAENGFVAHDYRVHPLPKGQNP